MGSPQRALSSLLANLCILIVIVNNLLTLCCYLFIILAKPHHDVLDQELKQYILMGLSKLRHNTHFLL